MQPKDYYKILGVPETATQEEIKKAYRKIARENHPDRNPGNKAAEERFKEASEAYEILSNPEKRRKFDALRKYGFSEQGFGPGFPGGGFDPRRGGFRVRFNSGDMADMDFADLFTDDSPFASLFEQLFSQMRVQRPGSFRSGGARPGSFRPGGTRPRPRAGRTATKTKSRTSRSTDGDSFFRRDGLDVHCTIWLKLSQLEKGAKVKVRTPSGKKALVKIAPKTKIGTVLRLPGMGLAENGRRGDQYVHVEAVDA